MQTDAAERTDEAATERLLESHRGEIHALCYRMLGSLHDAEEVSGAPPGLVEAESRRAFWLPYVEVEDAGAVTREAARLGADVLLPVREGPAGWRAVVASEESGPVAFWQTKR
jgi:predicted enzyme related to lactoylglutathione lyase